MSAASVAPRKLPHLLLPPLLGLLWGFNWPAVKLSLVEIPPWTLRGSGLLAAGLFVALLARLRGERLVVARALWPRLIAPGVLTIAAFNVLLAFAQTAAPTSRAAVVTFTMPLWTALFAWFVLGERFDGRRRLGLCLGFAGLLALGLPLIRAGQFSVGLVYALLAGVSWAAGTVLTKRFPVPASPYAIAAWQLLIGGAIATAGALIFEGPPRFRPIGAVTAAAFAYHVLFAQALGYLVWFELMARVSAGAATLGTLMVPAVGFLSAMAILGERPSPSDGIGLVLVVAAAATVMLPRQA